MTKLKKPQEQELKIELLSQLELLRIDLQQTVERYRSSVEAELVNLIDLLSNNAKDEQSTACNDVVNLKFLIELINSNRHKKDKGRFKDVRRFHEIVKMLAERLSE